MCTNTTIPFRCIHFIFFFFYFFLFSSVTCYLHNQKMWNLVAQSESDEIAKSGFSDTTIFDSDSPMSSNSSCSKPQLLTNCAPGAPLSIPYLRRFPNLFSKNGKTALLERSLAAIGTEWTSRELLDKEPWAGLPNSSPCLPTLLPKIEGKGKGIGSGHWATERWQNIGLDSTCL